MQTNPSDLLRFYQSKDNESLEKAMSKLSKESLKQLLSTWVPANVNEDGINLLKALFLGQKGLPDTINVVDVYKECFLLLQILGFNKSFITEVICILNNEINDISLIDLVELCFIVINMVQNDDIGDGKLLAVFQKILVTVQQCGSVKHYKFDGSMSGAEFKQQLTKDLCSFRWPCGSVIHLTSMFREIYLNPSEADIVTAKLLEELNGINAQDIPPFIFQLVGFASAYNKFQTVLWGILSHFNALELQANTGSHTDPIEMDSGLNKVINHLELKSMEGTVLIYFGNAIRQNQLIGKGFLKIMKDAKQSLSPKVITPFFVALGLVVAQDNRFSEEAHSILRLLIYRCFQDSHKIKGCKFLKDHSCNPPDINQILQTVVKNCQQCWDHILQGLVNLCFNLMEHFGPKQAPGVKTIKRMMKKIDCPNQDACNAGITILSVTFKKNEVSRNEIISQLLNRIQINLNVPSYHYIRLLKAIVKCFPQAVLQCISQVKYLFEDLAMLHPYNVQKLLSALPPILKINPALRNSLILVLRKSLSSRHLNSRLSALYGFLLMLKHFPLSTSTTLSQVSSQSSQSIFSTASLHVEADVHRPSCAGNNNEMLCTEILQALRRCLSQQSSVRSELYLGTYEVICKNPRLANMIIEGMLAHLKKCYQEDSDIIPPLDLTSCFVGNAENLSIQDPLPIMLASLQYCLHYVTHNTTLDGNGDEILETFVINHIHKIFKSLTARMCKCDLQDFQFDQSSTPLSSSRSVTRNPLTIGVVMALYEVLIEYQFLHNNLSDENAQQILCLFQSYKKVQDLLQGNKLTSSNEKSLLEMMLNTTSLMFLANLVHALFCENDDPARNVLLSNDNFMKHVMFLLHSVLSFANNHGFFPGFSDENDRTLHIERALHACLHKFMLEKNNPDRSPITLSCLECVHLGVKYHNQWSSKSLRKFIATMSGEETDESSTQKECVSKVLKQLQRVIISFITKSDSSLTAVEKKVLSQLISTLETLVESAILLSDSDAVKQCTEWWSKFCMEHKLEDTLSTKHLVQSYLHTSCVISSHSEEPFQDFSTDIRLTVGSIENFEETHPSASYRIVSNESAQHLIPIVVKHMENIVTDCEWLVQHLKGTMMFSKRANQNEESDVIYEKRRKSEGAICSRLSELASGLIELALTAAGNTTSIENIIRGCTSFFALLTNFSKYYLWLYGQGIGHIPSKFEKLNHFIGSELMRPIYGFIMHAENVQTERLQAPKAQAARTKKATKEVVKNMSNAGKAKVLRESKGIARLVYTIEQHEHNLILLGRKSKLDFMKSHHLPTSRDFRIRSDVLRVNLLEQEASKDKDGDNRSDEEEDNQENEQPNKRPRLQT
ncbi:Fanconi anemia group I protein-like isoform X1 [Clavelina lepadiformis]|uniref:Fanconi anemia group I protein-like isoform X1 n=2 Tax=Clavelina lepadiformis TaxID=159417 RepID=UPI0040429E19